MLAYQFAKIGQIWWAAYSACSGFLVVGGVGLFGRGFGGAKGLVDVAGLIQRSTIVVGWGWLTLVAVHLLRGRRA